MNKVFERTSIGKIQLENRIIRSATCDGNADAEGRPTSEMVAFYEKLAQGGPGAIITGMMAVQQNGRASTYMSPAFHKDEFIEDYKKLTEAVHKHNVPIIAQITHCGRQTRRKATGMPTVAPSSKRDLYFLENLPKKLTEPEIEGIIENFIKTIERTKKAGYDGVQLHAAHGWLLCHFLCGNTNVRNDKWGGSMENKFRIIERIVTGARQRVGDYPILIKINGYDTLRNGMRIPEAVQVAKLLEKVGIDAIEVSCGMPNDGFITLRSKKFPTKAALEYSYLARWLPNIIKRIAEPFVPIGVNIIVPGLKELYLFNVSAAEAIKTAVNIPVIVVGGIKNLDDIEMIIGQGQADYVAMARAFIHDPNIVNKFKEGKLKDSRCLYCNYCITCIESMPARCFYGKLPHKHKQ